MSSQAHQYEEVYISLDSGFMHENNDISQRMLFSLGTMIYPYRPIDGLLDEILLNDIVTSNKVVILQNSLK
jgi:hypothetical protein